MLSVSASRFAAPKMPPQARFGLLKAYGNHAQMYPTLIQPWLTNPDLNKVALDVDKNYDVYVAKAEDPKEKVGVVVQNQEDDDEIYEAKFQPKECDKAAKWVESLHLPNN